MVNAKSDDDVITNQPEDKNITVYVSRNNGKVYHYDKTCSGLKKPNEMTLKEAQNEGVRACSKCVK